MGFAMLRGWVLGVAVVSDVEVWEEAVAIMMAESSRVDRW
jgi:hypothetical protein